MTDCEPQIPEKAVLQAISQLYPNRLQVLSTIAELEAKLQLPKETIHVISDIHGEYKKLRHIINNASGSLKPLVVKLFGSELEAPALQTFLNILHYPVEGYAAISPVLDTFEKRLSFVTLTVLLQARVMRELARRTTVASSEERFPAQYKNLIKELLAAPITGRDPKYFEQALRVYVQEQQETELLRALSRVIRNLLISELVIAGDFGDRGPRIDRVIDYVMHQPNVSITWGNHDTSWMGACLGSWVCIATVIRVSLRYRRLSQLEEGYGIPMIPLERLAKTAYGSDPATHFACKGEGLRDPELMSRMQKAIAVIQFKLEGQLAKRNPHFNLSKRDLLSRIDSSSGSVEIDNKKYQLRDTHFPTVDWADPLRLSPDEVACIERLCESFLHSPILWQQMRYLAARGSMYVVRDAHLIFHACVPVDAKGKFLTFSIDGEELSGRALFEKVQKVVQRSFSSRSEKDLDLLWYLWGGELSPLFGKDKMATFETYFVAEKETHKETKNAYFQLIHEADFCRKILAEFGVNAQHGLIVNGHVPVKIDVGESPLKKSGLAVTIDGAFSEAYGDKGYTLVLEADRTYLAQHHHFDSIEDAIRSGADIVPTIQELRKFDTPRLEKQTEQGQEIRSKIQLLSSLDRAYRENLVMEVS